MCYDIGNDDTEKEDNRMMMKVNKAELKERMEKNFERLQAPYYQIQEVFSDASYDWPGDKEGRALLAFVCHYAIHGKKIPCMDQLIEILPQKTNSFSFFGDEYGEFIDEQQISGNSWYLRGLLEYYQQFGDERVLSYAKSTVEHLYLPLQSRIASYPLERTKKTEGDVSGSVLEIRNGWKLSTDIGCVFMCIDGLSHYYEITGDKNTGDLMKEMKRKFDEMDVVALQAQTHCCLTAARGFLRMYGVTKDKSYLDSAMRIAGKYIECGMTDTYQNYNWWGRGETWTEPCAVVDSLMVMTELYKITKKEEYRKLAVRIWHNGFAALQVGNGGAGTNTTVNANQPILHTLMYEAYFCCTMRLAEGLRYMNENQELLYAETGELKKDRKNRYMAGDILYAEIKCAPEWEKMIDRTGEVECDGIRLQPLLKYYCLPKEATDSIEQRVIF